MKILGVDGCFAAFYSGCTSARDDGMHDFISPGIRSSIAFYSGCTSARDDGRRGFTKGSDGALRHTGSVQAAWSSTAEEDSATVAWRDG